ncbi:MAG: polysaccharide deacetylase family protein [Caldilineaceae bacterium]|nr:polysaccharide deacetylase family protein [Caldilineaceae bacterium]MDE0339603.1 polysaccharide deacetylase family protein [Caldilineaceae bacterium]
MNRLYLTLALAVLITLSLASCHPVALQPEQSTATAPSAPEAAAPPVHASSFDATKYENVWVHAIEEVEHDGRSLLRVSYPFTEKESINARMEAVTQEFIDEWRLRATDTEASYQEYKKESGTNPVTFITHYRQYFDVSIANENLIFFDIVRGINTGGTGNSYVVGYIFDRRTGAELTISDLFVDDSYLERLSVLTREALLESIAKEELYSDPEWVQSGTVPTAENFDNILLRENGTILVKFDKYQVAAGVSGVVDVVLPLSEIADLLKPEIRQLLGIDDQAAVSGTEVAGVMEIEESENDGRSTLYVSYPTTDDDKVNSLIEAVSRQFMEEFRITAAEIEESYQEYKKETGKEAASFVTHYRQDHEATVVNEQVLFFAVERSTYTGGSGNETVSSYIFDLRQGTEIAIPDLFTDDSYLQRLSELSREALAERLRSQIAEREPDADDDRRESLFESEYGQIETGTEPSAENFDFIVFRDGGTFLLRFDKYQVASGVEGTVEVELAVADVSDLLRPEIRQLLGIEEDATTLRTDFGLAVASAWAPASSPVVMSALSSRGRIPTLSRMLRISASAASPAEQVAEEEINCNEVPCVALTFDDGPSYYTEGLLDTLKEHNVKATFFVLGTQVRIQSETVQRMFQEGHQIGNHTWDHPNLTQLSDTQIREQLQLSDDLIAQLIGEKTPFLRPPYGAYNERVLAASGLPIIFWSVDPLDWKDRDAATVAARIAEAPVGAIILSHDIHKSTVEAVPAIIAALHARGIHFVTVSKLFEPQTLHAQTVYIRQTDPPSQ